MLNGINILLGVSGGIAAYKTAELVRCLTKAGATVQVVMTANAQRFVTPLTLQTLSGQPVCSDLFNLEMESQIGHIHVAVLIHLAHSQECQKEEWGGNGAEQAALEPEEA